MKIDIHSNDIVLDEKAHERILQKLNLAMSRMEPFITTISMHLSNVDISGHANEKHCQLKIALTQMPNIITDDIQTDLSFAIDRVIQKASRALSRKLERDK